MAAGAPSVALLAQSLLGGWVGSIQNGQYVVTPAGQAGMLGQTPAPIPQGGATTGATGATGATGGTSSSPGSTTTTQIGSQWVTSGRLYPSTGGSSLLLVQGLPTGIPPGGVSTSPAPSGGTPGQSGGGSVPVPPGTPGDVAQALSLINAQRAQAGVGPLALDPQVSTLALERAQVLASLDIITHDVPGYGLPAAMEMAAGIQARLYSGEDIAAGATVYTAFEALMASPWHKANLLFAPYNTVGIGVAPMANGMVMLDLMFLEE